METLQCKTCGGILTRNGNYNVCRFCGNKWTIDVSNDVHVVDRANAWSALRDNDFERAVELFENILIKEPEHHEACWGLALSSHGIMYVTDLNENKKVYVIALNASAEGFYEHIGFKRTENITITRR